MTGLRVLLWHRHAVVRDGLALLLAELDEVDEVRLASCSSRLADLAVEQGSDCAVVDLDDPSISWGDLAALASDGTVRVVGLYRRSLARDAVRAFDAGVRALVPAAEGWPALALALGRRPLWATQLEAEGETPLLNRVEVEVLRLLARGMTARGVARQLRTSPSKVDEHKQAAFDKLGAGHQSEAVAEALRRGLLDVPTRDEGLGSSSTSTRSS